jgi:hypothetical protein
MTIEIKEKGAVLQPEDAANILKKVLATEQPKVYHPIRVIPGYPGPGGNTKNIRRAGRQARGLG